MIWIAYNDQPAPIGLQYSHRCHNENCINPNHGIWESDQNNKSRNRCANSSHVILPNHDIILTCPHKPPCLTPTHIRDADDSRIIKFDI
jgi:homing endonuclease-like protein